MEKIAYWAALALIRLIQALPLPVGAWMGRQGGAVAWVVDRRHRRVAESNLADAFPELPRAQVSALVRRNFRQIGESYVCALKTAVMPLRQVQSIVEIVGLEHFTFLKGGPKPTNCIVAIGHFGNFELYALLAKLVPGFTAATTYRGLRQPGLNKLLQEIRGVSGCRFFERRSEADALKAALNKGGVLLGLLADQHAGRGGLPIPFLGRECSTNAAPAVFALRYDAPLYTAVCYRIGPARWRVEVNPEIPTRSQGEPRSSAEIMLDVNRAFEAAVRRDPANWFWVHNRWKLNRPPARKSPPAELPPQPRGAAQ